MDEDESLTDIPELTEDVFMTTSKVNRRIGILLMCVDDDPIDSYGSPADDGGGEDDGHHDSHTVKAPMMRLCSQPHKFCIGLPYPTYDAKVEEQGPNKGDHKHYEHD